MSLETLLEAARYVEQQEKKRERVASTSSSSDHSFAVAPYSNHHNSNEPRGAKMKRERSEPDDLFCEEKMLIIDEEDPLDISRTNGNHSTTLRGSSIISRGALTNTTQTNIHHVTTHHQINNHNNSPHNNYVDNNSTNHNQSTTSVVDMDSSHDNKKHRNGPCVIRSGTREVHNKLEKNRRAHLKECFEMLKKQLPAQDEKKSSNLSILHAAIRHIQTLRRKERDSEHEMERLAREKIAAQQRIVALKKELSTTWDHLDFSELLQEQRSAVDPLHCKNVSESMDVDVSGLARGGTRYSSTSSLSSAATASSPQNHQTTSTTSSITTQVATAAVVCQTQGLNLAQSSRESPPASSSPGASTPSIPTPAQEKVPSPPVVQQSQQLHLPLSAHVLNTSQGLATIVPALQHLGSSLRVIPGDTRQLLVAHTTGSSDQTRNIIAMQSNAGSEQRQVLVVQSTASDNRVTLVHSNLSNQERNITLAGSDGRPLTFLASGNEGRSLVLAHPPPLNVTTQARMRPGDSQTTLKVGGGVTLVGGNAELARLPGGAELNLLPAFRAVKTQPVEYKTVPAGLTLSHTGVSLQQSPVKPMMQSTPSTESVHIVGQHTTLSGLTPLVTPMTVVSQGNQVTAHILAPSSLPGKMITTPILKTVGPMQYLNTTTLMKPTVVVVSSPNSTSSTIASSTQPSVTSHSNV